MLRFLPNLPADQPMRILCVGAHCDDIEIGAGGTLLRLAQERAIEVEWVVLTSDPLRSEEAKLSARWFLSQGSVATTSLDRVHIHGFRPSYLPSHFEELKDLMTAVRGRFDPHLVFTHHRGDRHQDHNLTAELTWNAFRDHTILEYEIAKYEGDLGHPNAFVELAEPLVLSKVGAIRQHFHSQADKTWFDEEAFRAVMRLRGIECNAASGFAEAFHLSKIQL